MLANCVAGCSLRFDYYSMSFGLESVGGLTRCRISAPHYDTISSPSLPTSLDSVTYQSVFLVHALPFSKAIAER